MSGLVSHGRELRPNQSPDCVISQVNHPMIDFSPHHLARVRREFEMAKGKGPETWQSPPTINLSADLFLSLSLKLTTPRSKRLRNRKWGTRMMSFMYSEIYNHFVIAGRCSLAPVR